MEHEDEIYDIDTDALDNLNPKDLALIVCNLIDHEMPVPVDFIARLHKAGIYIDNRETRREHMAKKIITTPIGTAVFPHLRKPDTFKGQEHFKVSVELPKAEAEAFKAKVLEMADLSKLPKKPKTPVKDGRDDSVMNVTAKSKYAPGIFDAHKNRIPESIDIAGGSKIRAICEVYQYDEGVSLRLLQVQVVQLRERAGGNCAFEEIEDGYTYEGGEEETSGELIEADDL
jgi:hypothetical protein